MTATIDHLVYRCQDLAVEVERIAGLTGVRPAYGGQHPGLGTHNALLSLAPRSYLEIIAPDPAQPRPDEARPFGLDDMPASRLRAWAAAPDDLDAALRASVASGFSYGPVVAGHRRTAAGREITWRMTASTRGEDDNLAVPFLIDWAGSPHPAQSAPGGVTLVEFRLAAPDPHRLTARLRVLGLDLPVDAAPQAGLRAVLAGQRGDRVVLSS